MVESKAKGITTELLCQAYLSSLGYNISVPIGEDCRYDLILDVNSRLLRIQIKTCREKENCIEFNTQSVHPGKVNIRKSYNDNEIDYFATYYNDTCYLIPVNECLGASRSLSFTGQRVNEIKPLFIEDYCAEKVINKILNNETLNSGDDFVVYQYDLNNKLINTFPSYALAGESIGKASSHISQAARGLRKTAYGYIWTIKPKD